MRECEVSVGKCQVSENRMGEAKCFSTAFRQRMRECEVSGQVSNK